MKVLLFDIETAPIIAHVWGLYDNNVGLNQIVQDWHVLSWSAKWLDKDNVMYQDQRNAKDVTNDKNLLKSIWKLLDEADIVVTQNGIDFDVKKLNARFVYHGFQPPSSFRHIDTKRLAKKYFGFTSNRLEYMTEKLNVKYKKQKHKKFPGHEMWTECLKGNRAAWREMERYNKYDVLALEELYKKLIPWDTAVNFSVYTGEDMVCSCGSREFKRNGFFYSSVGKYQRFKCTKCGAEKRDRKKAK